MTNENNNMRELFAEARSIHYVMQHGVITYEQAKLRVQPILRLINDHVGRIAKECRVKPRFIRFQDLGRNL